MDPNLEHLWKMLSKMCENDFVLLPCCGITKVSIPKEDSTPINFEPMGNVNSGYISYVREKPEILERKEIK